MKPSFPAPALLAAAALLACGHAHAQSTATATFSFAIQLTDLDPSDGIAPGIVLDPLARSSVIASSSGTGIAWSGQGDSAFGAASTGGQVGGTGGSASFAGDPLGAGATVVASATSGPALDIGSARAAVDPGVDALGYTMFTLTPHTEFTLSGIGTAAWNASNPGAAAYDEIDVAFARQDGAGGLDLLGMGDVVGGYYGTGFGPLSGVSGGLLGFTFDNDSDVAVFLGFQMALYATASESDFVLPPVDEPAGAAELAAGAALLGGLALRRRRRERQAISGGSGGCRSAPSRCRARRPR